MQAVRTRATNNQQTATATSNTQAVIFSTELKWHFIKRLLQFSFGAIAFHRNLLPDEAFQDHKVKADYDEHQNPRITMDVKMFKEGECLEADTLAAHLTAPSKKKKTPAGGIYDAIAKRYLKKLSFVILLDPNDRDNVIEAYTFDFSYSAETGSPDISLSQISSLTSAESSSTMTAPASEADLQMIMIDFLTTLNEKISELPALPRQRYVDIRLQYTDDTPTDYHAADFHATNGSLFMKTHNMDEVPVSFIGGHFSTGDHDVSLLVSSAAQYLPHEAAAFQFDGEKGIALHSQSEAIQKANAGQRTVAWDTENITICPSATRFSAAFVAAIAKTIVGRRGERTKDWIPLEEDSETVSPHGANRPGFLPETHTSLPFIHHSHPTTEPRCFESSGGLNDFPPSATEASLVDETPLTTTVPILPPPAPRKPKAAAAPNVPKTRKATTTPKTATAQKVSTISKTLKSMKTAPDTNGQGNATTVRKGRQPKLGEGRAPASAKEASGPKGVTGVSKTPKTPSKSSKKTQKTTNRPKTPRAQKAQKSLKNPKSGLGPQAPQLKSPMAPPHQQQPSPAALSIPSNSIATNSRSFDERAEKNPLPTTTGGSASFQAPGGNDVRFGRMLAPLDFGMAG